MSCSAKRCLSFFKALKVTQKFEWNKDCEKAFEELNKFLTTPPLLSCPTKGETLYLYIFARKETIGTILVREEDAQALADFLAEITPSEAEESVPELIWELHVIGTSNEKGAGAGAILKGLGKVKIEYGVNIQSAASKNAAEYEALIAGLGLALELKTEILKIYSDSQLVVNQVKGEY
ncbi:uncharacterized protein LOC126681671 [Mercurialis annua]|uniref:uncharacterized protein LOC126681671 n=1 Tax=Mercurialis annua TaxID=3986 RepID=UPI00216034D8|nr:uncharacterized protein LOC126681671 [Mercurialis annua]